MAEHILPVIETKEDQNVKKVVTLLYERYGRTRTEKVEEAIDDYFRFREDNFDDDDELMLSMSELRKRRVDLEMTFDEFHTVWMLQKLQKRKRTENFEIQSLREIVKTGGPDVVKTLRISLQKSELKEKGKPLKML